MEKVNCNYCLRFSHKELFAAEDIFSKEKFILNKCINCGFVFVSPRPGSKEISRYYPEKEYFLESKTCIYSFENDSQETLGLNKSADIRLRAQSLSAKYIFGQDKDNEKGLISRIRYFVIGHRFGRIKGKIGKGKILDVGCGDATFLKILKELQWEVCGTEVNQVAAEKAQKKGIDVFCGDLRDAKYLDETFDVVRMWSVLEHLHDPSSYLEEIKRILRPGGVLLVQVPNFGGFASKIFGNKWSGLDVPRHLYHFDQKHLKGMMGKQGFQICNIHTISVGTIAASLNMNKFTIIRAVVFIFEIILNYLNLGDSIVCYAKKQ